jgi:pyrroline-5-carboxylate reductase
LSKRIAIIGIGAMGSAVLERLIRTNYLSPGSAFACDPDKSKLDSIEQMLDIGTSADNNEGARFGDAIVLAVPPKQARQVLEEIRPSLQESKILISLVALLPTSLIEATLRLPVGVVRVMPNIPSMVGSGFNVFCFGRHISSGDKEWVKSMLSVLGEHEEVDEDKIETYTVLSAMGPTYFLPFADELIRFGASNGLSYQEARKAVASTMRGTSELASKVDRPIEELKNMIGTQPLKMREQELRSIMQEELGKTLQQLKTAKDRLSG